MDSEETELAFTPPHKVTAFDRNGMREVEWESVPELARLMLRRGMATVVKGVAYGCDSAH